MQKSETTTGEFQFMNLKYGELKWQRKIIGAIRQRKRMEFILFQNCKIQKITD